MLPLIAPALGFISKNGKVFGFLGAGLVIFLAFNYVQGLRSSKAQLEENVVVLEGAVSVERASFNTALEAIEEWKVAQKKLQDKIEEMNAFSVEANEEVRRLDELYSNHDLRALALAKPGLIERRINSGTRRIFRLLEAATTDTTGRSSSGG